MTVGQIVLLVYAMIIETGGVIGFLTAQSKPSLIAGTVSAALLFAAFAVTFFNAVAGFWMATGIALLLVAVFAIRLAKTRKFMPSGMLILVSLVACGLLVSFALEAAKSAG